MLTLTSAARRSRQRQFSFLQVDLRRTPPSARTRARRSATLPHLVNLHASRERGAFDELIDRAHGSTIERKVAIARTVAALGMLFVMLVGSGPLHPYAALVLLTVYVAYSGVIVAALTFFASPLQAAAAAVPLHLADLAWATAVTALSGGVSSHTFLLFLFVLAAAAYRWSTRGALYTGAVVIAIATAEGLAAFYGYVAWAFELDNFILFASYVALFAVLFGLLAERMHTLRAEAILLGRVLRQVAGAHDVRDSLHSALRETLDAFGAKQVLLVARELDGETCGVWCAERSPDGGAALTSRPLSAAERDLELFPAPGHARAWEVHQRDPGRSYCNSVGLTGEGMVTSDALCVPHAALGIARWQTLTIAAVDVPRYWTGRLILVDAHQPADVVVRLAVLQKLVEHVAPSLAGLHLLQRLRSRAEAVERARIARELHDGIIQSLAVLDVRLEVAGRRVATVDPEAGLDLQRTREMLQSDRMGLRDLIERMRTIDVNAATLQDELRTSIARFTAVSGIRAELVWALDTLDLPPRHCREVVRIVQEALVNVRRHSGASRALVRIAQDASDWEITIEDNGHGFPLEGRISHDVLVRRREGPRVIRERVEALDGTLDIESSAKGARLLIALPRVPRRP